MSVAQRLPAAGSSERWQVAFDPWVVAAFLFPFGRLFSVDIGGKVFLQDFFAVALVLVMAGQKDTPQRLKRLLPLLLLGVFWLFGQIVTDIIRDTNWENIRRGWFKIILFLFQVSAVWIFVTRRKSYLVAFTIGTAVGMLMNYFVLEEGLKAVSWKYDVGNGLALLVALVFTGALAGTQPLRRICWLGLLLVGMFLLLRGYRSGFGQSAAAAGLCFAALLIERSAILRQQFNRQMFAVFLILSVFGGQLITETYSFAASSGWMGEAARAKYLMQSEGDVSIIRGGRVESLVSTTAIADSPIIGHGSWARDLYYVRLLRQRMKELGLRPSGTLAQESTLIPTHSYFFGGWVEAGFAGGLFWLYVVYASIVALFYMMKRPDFMLPVSALSICTLVWSILFSPFGAEARFTAAYQIVLLFWIIHTGRIALENRAISRPA